MGFFSRIFVCALLGLLTSTAHAAGRGGVAASVPSISSISPRSAVSGSADFTLTVSGAKFTSDSTVFWNGDALSTTFVSVRTLRAFVPASELLAGGDFLITVSSGTSSNAKTFQLKNPAPMTTAVQPTAVVPGTLTVSGRNFIPASLVLWNGQPLQTAYVSGTVLHATVTAGLIHAGQQAKITVVNPQPGGGGSAFVAVMQGNYVPGLTGATPRSFLVGQSAATLTLTGTHFVSDSKVYWDGTALDTTFVSATSLTATVPASLFASGSDSQVSVVSPGPGGGASNTADMTVSYPAPSITLLSPNALANDHTGTFLITGTGFGGASTVNWDGVPTATTYLTPTTLQVSESGVGLTAGSTHAFSVSNPTPGGGTSNTVSITIVNPAPALTGVTPNSFVLGQSAATLTLTGTHFVSGSKVYWNSTALATTYVSATSLTAAAPASLFAGSAPSTAQVTVVSPTPGGGTTAGSSVSIVAPAPAPTMTGLSQIEFTVGQSNDGLLAVAGTGFTADSQVMWGDTALPTTYVSATSLKAAVPAAFFAPALFPDPHPMSYYGIFLLTQTTPLKVVTPGPGGGTSSSVDMLFTLPAPVLVPQSLVFPVGSENSLYEIVVSGQPTAGLVDVQTMLVGANESESVFGGNEFTASYDGAYREVLDSVWGVGTDTATTYKVGVVNTTNESNLLAIYVAPQSAIIQGNSTPATYGVVGTSGLEVTLTGQGFLPGVTVYANGTSRPTTWISDTEISFTLSQTDVAFAQVFTLTLKDAGVDSEVSPPYYYPVGISLQEIGKPINDMVWDATNQVIYASVPAPEPADSKSIITIDPATGTETNSVALSAAPDVLAISDDNSYLYAGSATAATPFVQQFTLPGTVAGVSWTLGSVSSQPYAATALSVKPGSPHTVVVGRSLWGGAVEYDDGVARSDVAAGDIVQNRRYDGLAWSTNGGYVYASNFDFGTGMYMLTPGSTGLSFGSAFSGTVTTAAYPHKLYSDAYTGDIFTDSGDVFSPSTGSLVTHLFYFNGSSQGTGLALDDAKNRAYLTVPDALGIGTYIYVFNLQNFAQIGSIYLPMVYPSTPSRLIRWGAHGLALRNGTSSFYIIQGDFIK